MVSSLIRSIDPATRPVHNRPLVGRRGVAPARNLIQRAPATKAVPLLYATNPDAWRGDGRDVEHNLHW